ncbi:MAG: SDR family NAD(P)-dependent oxidoreductase [Hymenobacter sp.]
MKQQHEGHIINVASLAATAGTAKLAGYRATKYAVRGFSGSPFQGGAARRHPRHLHHARLGRNQLRRHGARQRARPAQDATRNYRRRHYPRHRSAGSHHDFGNSAAPGECEVRT